jgi:hypothetical protein
MAFFPEVVNEVVDMKPLKNGFAAPQNLFR